MNLQLRTWRPVGPWEKIHRIHSNGMWIPGYNSPRPRPQSDQRQRAEISLRRYRPLSGYTERKAMKFIDLQAQYACIQDRIQDRINRIADAHGPPVIEDGAQSRGATYNGRHSCGLPTMGCASFFPSKPLGGYGDSGACFTDDDDLAKLMREIRNHGQDRRYHHQRIGGNGRLDTLQAAILLVKLDLFPEEVELRAQVGERYTRLIEEKCPGVVPPFIAPENTSVYAQYTLLVKDREAVQNSLGSAEIPTAVHYPVPLNRQPALSIGALDLPVAEELSGKVVSLPMQPYLGETDQDRIVDIMRSR